VFIFYTLLYKISNFRIFVIGPVRLGRKALAGLAHSSCWLDALFLLGTRDAVGEEALGQLVHQPAAERLGW